MPDGIHHYEDVSEVPAPIQKYHGHILLPSLLIKHALTLTDTGNNVT